jgi:hypothetical protein
MQKRVFASLAALSFSLTACSGGMMPTVSNLNLNPSAASAMGRTAKKAGEKSWTVMVHLAADNNLYRFGLEDLNEMEAGLNSDDINVIVLFDGAKQGDSAIYKIKKDPNGKNTTIISEKLDDGGAVIPASKEIDSGDIKTNVKFAEWAVKNFPAQYYFQSHWDHGSGIFGKGRNMPTKGFGWDDNGSHMKTADITTLMAAVKNASGKNVEMLGFDACLMGHVELAYQAKGNANYMIASQELEPGAGWDYASWLSALSKNPGVNGAGLGKLMVKSYMDSYKPGGSQNPGGRSVEATLSTIDVNATVTKLTPALNNLAKALTAAYPTHKAALDDARKKTIAMDNTDSPDLGDFIKNAQAANLPGDVQQALAQTLAAYNQTIVANDGAGSPTHVKATGASIYFPRPDQSYNPVYSNPAITAFGAEGWKDYLLATKKTTR